VEASFNVISNLIDGLISVCHSCLVIEYEIYGVTKSTNLAIKMTPTRALQA
jgi:hypothetical protein